MRIYWLDNLKKGNLGMMARPKGNDWLNDEIKKLSFKGVNTVISLLEKHEEEELELEKEKTFCERYDIEFINFPIQDRDVPKNSKSFIKLINGIDKSLQENKKIVVHCRMGIGRTSVVVAGGLIKNNFEPIYVFDYLSKIRTLSVPDTNAQVEWIERIKTHL